MTPLNSEITIKVAGQAGQGLQTITWILMKALARRGSHLFAIQDFMSRVRGGHNFNQIRAGLMPFYSMVEKSHIIVALDRQSVEEHEKELDAPGRLIYDPDMVHIEARNKDFLPVPMNKMAMENGNILYANSVAVGCVLALMDIALEEVEAIFREQLDGKGEETLWGNVRSLRSGWDFVVERNLEKIFSIEDGSHKKRYKITQSGVSPMTYFNQGDITFMVDSHEHTEEGHITEDMETRKRMVEKRLRKAAGMAGEFGEPEFYGAVGAETVFLCWGSTYGAVREAVDALNNGKNRAGMVHLNRLSPFPSKKTEELIRGARRIINVEANATGQFRRLLRSETGICPHGDILRYDGRPMTGEYVLSELKFKVN